MLSKITTFFVLILSWAIYPLSFLTPRTEKIWIFVGWHKSKERETFADNSKYLFLYVANNIKNVRPIWIGADNGICTELRTHGYESANIYSWRGVYYSLRAKYTIIDANMRLANWRYSGRSRVIQLWHADGIKALDLGSAWKLSKAKDIFFQPGLFRSFYFLIASSRYIAEKFICPSFDVPLEKVRTTGLPRYDVFFRDIPGAEIDMHTELAKKLAEIKSRGYEKIVFFTPTFRRGKTVPEQLAYVDFDAWNTFLAAHNYFLIVSLHPKFSTSDWMPNNNYSHIYFSNPELDKFPLLKEFDVLITDYSSICLEFLLLDKPTIFYVPDLEEYRKDPGLPEEFWGLVPGPRAHTFGELLNVLEAPDNLPAERKRVRDILFTFEPGRASENVTRSILESTSWKPIP